MADTKIPLRKWLLAFHLMGASKKGMSALQLQRMLVTYQTAWHLCHRIRATMTKNSQVFTGIVETDETYIGGIYGGAAARAIAPTRRQSPQSFAATPTASRTARRRQRRTLTRRLTAEPLAPGRVAGIPSPAKRF